MKRFTNELKFFEKVKLILSIATTSFLFSFYHLTSSRPSYKKEQNKDELVVMLEKKIKQGQK